jgi:hypothetical protein
VDFHNPECIVPIKQMFEFVGCFFMQSTRPFQQVAPFQFAGPGDVGPSAVHNEKSVGGTNVFGLFHATIAAFADT